MAHLRTFVDSIRWWELKPDVSSTFLVAGLGGQNDLDRATATIADDGSLAVVYVPSQRTITVDLGRLAGWVATVRWFEPTTGTWIHGRTLSLRGFHARFHQFETPGPGDWTLLVEDPAHGRHGRWPPLGA